MISASIWGFGMKQGGESVWTLDKYRLQQVGKLADTKSQK